VVVVGRALVGLVLMLLLLLLLRVLLLGADEDGGEVIGKVAVVGRLVELPEGVWEHEHGRGVVPVRGRAGRGRVVGRQVEALLADLGLEGGGR
jgi:hypothetical protein